MKDNPHHRKFEKLINFLSKIPAISTNDTPWRGFGTGEGDDGWWIKFSIEISDPHAWHTLQELGYVLNDLSVTEILPTVFKPTSPPPYLNGGPADFLSWVIECSDNSFAPGTVADWLSGRLPSPVEDREQWGDSGG